MAETPCGVLQAGGNVLALQVRILGDYLRDRLTRREELEHIRDADA